MLAALGCRADGLESAKGMPMNKRGKLLLAGGLFFLVGAVVLALGFNTIVLHAMHPRGAFRDRPVPRPPDYADPASWSALPERVDAADAAIAALPAAAPEAARVDVFYVHPTSYIGGHWNGPIDDPTLNADTDRVATRLQASAFNGCCAVYAPRYRQANGTVFSHPSDSGEQAVALAYGDVAAAFRYYLQRYNRGRPLILASHSQGTMLAYRLLREEISGRPVRDRLVAAYLIGGPIVSDALAKEAPDLPVCGSAEQTGCVISWNARGPRYTPGMFDIRSLQLTAANSALQNGRRVCVNPLTWSPDETAAAASLNKGALFLEPAAPVVQPGFASAQCRQGMLLVTEIGTAPRDFPSRLLDRALGPQNYHPIEYQMFYVNLRENAAQRAAAFVRQHSPAPSQ